MPKGPIAPFFASMLDALTAHQVDGDHIRAFLPLGWQAWGAAGLGLEYLAGRFPNSRRVTFHDPESGAAFCGFCRMPSNA